MANEFVRPGPDADIHTRLDAIENHLAPNEDDVVDEDNVTDPEPAQVPVFVPENEDVK